MTPLEDKIWKIVAPAVDGAGFLLIRVRVTGAQNKTLQVMAERPDRTMSAGDCARLSRIISPTIEAEDPIQGKFVLEVSSPGIDRPLVKLRDFDDWRGWPAKLELDRLVEGRRKFKGVLSGVDDGNVAFDIDGENETALFPFEWIATAKLILTDELIQKSLKAGADVPNEQEIHHGEN